MKKIIFFLLVTSTIFAQKVDLNYYLPSNVTYNPKIPTPKSIIGHEVGEWHVTHDKLVEYMKVLAASSDRIAIEDRGKTFEDRPLLLLTITSPENHKNLETIRKNHIEATDNEKVDVSNQPIIVYQGFSIHGNEASGSNAALAVAYYLAAAQEIDDLLNNVVILFDPSLNPDGLQRFAYWANTNRNQHINPDPNDREYHEVWPGGRTNHYHFDLNRDWLTAQMPESSVRVKTFHKWLPNILTDHHEMGSNSTFFFQPGIPSRTHPLTPKMNQELTAEIGTYHAKALDKIGSLYFSKENYDDFYYGKGSTFPDINGSIGILFEQASSRGHAQETDNGILTFPFTIRNQFTAALSTLEAAKNMRVKIKKYQQDFYKQSRATFETKAIVFGDEKDAAKTLRLAEIMQKHQMKIYDVKEEFSSNGKNFKKGYSFAVPLNQKNHRLLKAMLDKRTVFEDSLFYDISAWTFNYAFNLDVAENVALSKLGNELSNLQISSKGVSFKSSYGYLMSWNEYFTPKALNAILAKDLRAKVAMKNFTISGKRYDYGTIFIPVQNQKLSADEMYNTLSIIAIESGVLIDGVTTGDSADVDLGSSNFETITNPKVAMLVGDGITSYDAGEIWHLFDQRFQMPISRIDVNYVERVDLSKYTHIIIPNASRLSNDIGNQLNTWVKSGGVLIGFENAIRWMDNQKLISLEFDKPTIEPATNVSFENRSFASGSQLLAGAIFDTKLDRSHPINFGFKNEKLPFFKGTTIYMKPDKQSFNNPIQYTANPLLAGYISKQNLKVIKNSVPFKTQRLGRGRTVAFTDNTNFRAFWYGTNKLLMNAVFFGDKM